MARRNWFFFVVCLIAVIGGCSLGSSTDDILDALNIEFERTVTYHDPETDQDVTATIKISGKDGTYSDTLGNTGSGTLEGETLTALFSGPSQGSGSVTINFHDNFQHLDGTIQYDDGSVVTFSN